jgi:hypothetical protein
VVVEVPDPALVVLQEEAAEGKYCFVLFSFNKLI